MEEGKLQAATALSAKLPGARGQLAATLYTHSPRDGMARLDPLLPVALRTGDWATVQRLVQGSRPDAKLENLNFLAGQLKQFAAGMQAAESGDLASAQAASLALDAELWRLSQRVHDEPRPKKPSISAPAMAQIMPDAKGPQLLSNLSVLSLDLRAAITASQKHLDQARALFAQAAREEKALGYAEPPRSIRPVAEAEGAALLEAGDTPGAHAAYQRALKDRPNSGFALYGMARASEAAGDVATARAEYTRFMEAWKAGDAARPEMAHARQYLEGGKAVAAAATKQ
jgi:tetratricopeptide (TPR) repeat protein